MDQAQIPGSDTGVCRVVVVASTAHAFGKIDLNDLHYKKGRSYSPWPAYGQSKLANILFTKELSRRLEGTKVTATCLHPGVIATPLWRDAQSWLRSLFLPFLKDKTVPQGTATTIYACLEDSAKVGEERFPRMHSSQPLIISFIAS